MTEATNKPKPKRLVKTKVENRNEKIQGTNDSSIVSKRSVERLYWSKRSPGITNKHEKERKIEYFRPFVAKPQRRSPTINRGYWTRMEAIINHIQFAIDSNNGSKTVVVGLGAGFDPYPFQYLHEKLDPSDDSIIFVDIDFPDLVKRKAQMILQAPEIVQIIGEPTTIPDHLKSAVQLMTPKYIALGCDLTKLEDLTKTFIQLFDVESSSFVFTAEVSITYMPQKDADNVISWTSTFSHSTFILLEQILPAGTDHPFAKTMLKHFNNLNTPLNSVLTYPTVNSQIERFRSRNWKTVNASDLYQFYENAITQEQKEFLNSVEPFDEWEEFILFCQHYVILHATNEDRSSQHYIKSAENHIKLPNESACLAMDFDHGFFNYHKKYMSGCKYDNDTILINGGLSTTRTNESSLISTDSKKQLHIAHEPFRERMCHSLSNLGNGAFLLAGGRLAPNKPLSDCWILKENKWSQLQDIPVSKFRHHSVVSKEGKLLIFGGKGSANNKMMDWLIYESNSWKYIKGNFEIPNLYGSSVAWKQELNQGYIFGGFSNDNTFSYNVYKFQLSSDESTVEISELTDVVSLDDRIYLSRFGGKATFFKDDIIIVGGVTDSRAIDLKGSLLKFNPSTNKTTSLTPSASENSKFPLYVGFGLDIIDDKLIVYGGGTVCFSFGSYWNDGSVILSIGSSKIAKTLHLIHKSTPLLTVKTVEKSISLTKDQSTVYENKPKPLEAIALDQVCKTFPEFLSKIYKSQTPIGLTKLGLGDCLTKWKNPQYLIDAIGYEKKIIVHSSTVENMNFVTKNFDYKTMEFGQFINAVFAKDESGKEKENSKLYLRSLSSANPKTKPANFYLDYPELAKDFVLPSALKDLKTSQFSSPLRIATSETSIWLHYDVTANVLFQLVGHKTVRLYPPSDAQYLSFPEGSSTSIIENIFEYKEAPGPVHPVEIELGPGDAVFIPACWLHATRSKEPSISLNFFWKDLDEKSYGIGKDVYGNKDLLPYENGRNALKKIFREFQDHNDIPAQVKKFYLLRLAEEFKKSIENDF